MPYFFCCVLLQATYNTVPEWPHKASAFIVFPDVRAACQASSILRDETGVDAVELFDRCVWGEQGGSISAAAALHSCC
jgi:hypothetical protein